MSIHRRGLLLTILCTVVLLCTGACGSGPDNLVDDVHSRPGLADRGEAERERALLELGTASGIDVPARASDLTPLSSDESDPTEEGLWQAYQETIGAIEQELVDQVRRELAESEIREYIHQHPERFERQDTIRLTATTWEKGRAKHSEQLLIEHDNVRKLQEGNDPVVAVALDMRSGERRVVPLDDGRHVELHCISREPVGPPMADEVLDAAAMQLAREILDTKIAAEQERRSAARR